MNKENVTATPTFTRKRAKSFSTPPTAKPVARSARGILKGNNNGDDAHTIAFMPIHSATHKRSDSAEKRRKSLNRRVSFASHASVRLFEKPGESPPQTTPRRSTRSSPAKSPIASFDHGSPSKPSLVADDLANDESNDDITMDLTNIVPRMAPLVKQTNPLSEAHSMSDDDSESDSDDSEDDQMGEDDTAAMDLTDILPPASNQAKMPAFHSRIPRRSMSPSKVNHYAEPDEDGNETMDMTRAIGTILPADDPTSPFIEKDDAMEMTRLVGGIIHAAQNSSRSPIRKSLYPVLRHVDLKIIERNEDDMTMNMDETRVYAASPVMDEPTSHTSYTVATEEDDTQRLCEGSVTQADGLTQNIDVTKALPVAVHTAKSGPQNQIGGLGFSWGASAVHAEQSLIDISMADITQSDETVNMDMTQAVPGNSFFGVSDLQEEQSQGDQTVDMDMTRVVPQKKQSEVDQTIDMDVTRVVSPERHIAALVTIEDTPELLPEIVVRADEDSADMESDMSFTKIIQPPSQSTLPNERPSATALDASPLSAKKVHSPRVANLKRRLSSGAVRSPRQPQFAPPSASVPGSPQADRTTPSTPRRQTLPRRQSLLDTAMPQFGTPESKVILEPGSAQRPEFGAALVATEDRRISIIKDKIQSLTPNKSSMSAKATPVRTPSREAITAPKLESVSKSAKFTTPQKTPQRSLLAPTASASRSMATTPGRSQTDPPLSPILLQDFLKMTGISFLTGLSTTRRRETIALPRAEEEGKTAVDKEADRVFAQAFTVPMLEMYQHSCRELTKYITEGRAMCDEIESDMNDQNPEVFDQYRRADASGKRELENKFKAQKTIARLSAKGVWYVWRENLLNGVLVPLKKNLADLEKEAARLKAYEETATPLFEEIKKEYDELKATVNELVAEESRYESFDHEEAERLMQMNTELEANIEAETKELEIAQAQEAELQEQLRLAQEESEQMSAEIARIELEAEQNRGYTADEIADLKRTYEDLVVKTGLQLQHVDKDHINLLYKESLEISVALDDNNRIRVAMPGSTAQGDIMFSYYLTQINQSVAELAASGSSCKDSLKFVRDQWSAVLELREEVELLETAYPLTVQVNEDDNLQITASVLLIPSRTKFLVNFTSTPLLSSDECSLDVTIDVKYGGLDGAKLQKHVLSRLHTKSNVQRRTKGWLLDSLRMPEGL